MKVIRYVNGKKVQDLNNPDNESSIVPATTPVSVKRVIKQVVNPSLQPPQVQPSKGCGCGR